MPQLLERKNKYGSVKLERRGRILIARYSGAISGSLLRFFIDNLEVLLGEIKGSPWGYLSSSDLAAIGTTEVEALSVKVGKLAIEWGCVQGAYVLKSPVALAQTRRVRQQIGLEQPLEEVLFETDEEALSFLESAVSKYV